MVLAVAFKSMMFFRWREVYVIVVNDKFVELCLLVWCFVFGASAGWDSKRIVPKRGVLNDPSRGFRRFCFTHHCDVN